MDDFNGYKSMASINCCMTYCMSNLVSSVHGNLYSIYVFLFFGSSSVGIVTRSRHCSGADLGFSGRGANHSSGSLKQGVWGAQPPRSYRIFCFMKYRNAT